jgi:diaminopimelate decarboxylase
VGGCSLREIAERFGTPAYVIDEQALRARARDYLAAFTRRHARSRVSFAVKAYPSVSMISFLAREGLGFDVVGAGELRLALARAWIRPRSSCTATPRPTTTSRPRSTPASATSPWTGSTISTASEVRPRAHSVLLRVSPGIESATHAAMATGGVTSKFGLPIGAGAAGDRPDA